MKYKRYLNRFVSMLNSDLEQADLAKCQKVEFLASLYRVFVFCFTGEDRCLSAVASLVTCDQSPTLRLAATRSDHFFAFHRVLPGFTGYYWVLLGFTWFYWFLLCFTLFYWVLLGFTEFYRVLLGFTGFYWVLLGFTGPYGVLRGLTGFKNRINDV